MAISKVTLNGTTLMDATSATATNEEIISGYTALTADGVMTTGTAISGEYTAPDWFDFTKPTGDIVTDAIEIWPNALYKRTGAITVTATIATYVGDSAFQLNTGITKIFGKRIRGSGANTFSGATNLEYVVFGDGLVAYSGSFSGCSKLKAVDFGGSPTTAQGFLRTNIFNGARVFDTLVLRGDTVWPLSYINVFSNTPFADGGAGGTIYIKKVLYDHLGDGSALDYKSATNWSTVDGYGTITWAQIEGSQYENYYADGTPIT